MSTMINSILEVLSCVVNIGWGGVYSKIWAPSIPGPPQNNFSGKQRFFRKMLATGGGGWYGGRRYFLKTKVPKSFAKQLFSRNFQNFQRRNPSFLKNFQHARAPSPQVEPPFFTFFWGCYPPPPQVARPCSVPTCSPLSLGYAFLYPQGVIHN